MSGRAAGPKPPFRYNILLEERARPMPLRARIVRRITGFLGLSVLLHLNIALIIIAVLALRPEGCAGKRELLPLKPLEVSLVDRNQEAKELAARLDELQKASEQLKKEEKKDEQKEKDLKGQVVDVPKPLEEKQPDKARFLAEHDTKVDKETKGRPAPYKPGRLIADRPGRARQPAPPAPLPEREQREVERKVMKLAMRPRAEPDVPRSELPPDPKGDEPGRAPPRDPNALKGPRSTDDGAVDQSKSKSKKKLTLKDLRLSDSELARAVGSRVNDYLKDVEDGEQTLLNTRRWRFATFFNRVKRQVAENWHPDVVYKRRDPSGNVYGFRDRLTILRVRLTPQGKLKDLHLEKACGVGFLDDEAIAAFKAAEPFPNPPAGLVDKQTGVISFRFGFLFEISSRPAFRIFRFGGSSTD